jgi:hypothetical protein
MNSLFASANSSPTPTRSRQFHFGLFHRPSLEKGDSQQKRMGLTGKWEEEGNVLY